MSKHTTIAIEKDDVNAFKTAKLEWAIAQDMHSMSDSAFVKKLLEDHIRTKGQ